MKIGLISDTHGFFEPKLTEHFSGVDHILHAGDICGTDIIPRLEQIAPVTAVLGNNDFDPTWRELEVVDLEGVKFLIYHIVSLNLPGGAVFDTIARIKPDIVVFGHTHKASDTLRNGVRYINPGYAGRPQSSAERSVGILDLKKGDGDARITFINL